MKYVVEFFQRAHEQCRGTKLIGANKLSRYKEFNCVQMRVSGCNGHYEFVLGAGAKAKSVTNNLPILSVLGGRSFTLSGDLTTDS